MNGGVGGFGVYVSQLDSGEVDVCCVKCADAGFANCKLQVLVIDVSFPDRLLMITV